MAIFRPAPLLGAISGNLQGVNFVLTKGSPIVRARIRRTKQSDQRHTIMRGRLQIVRHAWQNLTEEQRTAWRQTANDFPHKNRLGIATRITGFNLFVKANMFAYQIPGASPIPIISDPPNLNAPDTEPFISLNIISGGSKSISFATVIPPPTHFVFVYAARTLSTAPRKFWNTYKLTESLGITVPATEITNWDSVIGDPQVGEQCWVRIWFFLTTIQLTGPFDYSTFAL